MQSTDFDGTWNFLDSSKNTEILNFMVIRPVVVAEMFHADRRKDGRTDKTKLIVAFRNFAYTPKNPVRTSQRTHRIHYETNQLMLYRDVLGNY
jgi:hypothetical protein